MASVYKLTIDLIIHQSRSTSLNQIFCCTSYRSRLLDYNYNGCVIISRQDHEENSRIHPTPLLPSIGKFAILLIDNHMNAMPCERHACNAM